jgi:hypothetical protein
MQVVVVQVFFEFVQDPFLVRPPRLGEADALGKGFHEKDCASYSPADQRDNGNIG